MQISKSYETEQGTVKFEGEVSGIELDVILTLGLNQLLLRGVMKPTIVTDSSVIKGTETLQ